MWNVNNDKILPGARVMVFDYLLFKNDKTTPLSRTMKPATVVCRYGTIQDRICEDFVLGPYPDCVDVLFDHQPERVSKGHFTSGVELVEKGGT